MADPGSELFLVLGPLLLLALVVALAIVSVRLVRLRTAIAALTRDARELAGGQQRRPPRLESEAAVTDLRQSVAEVADVLRAQVATAEAEHAQLAAILATMGDGVIVLDAGGRVVVINEAATELVGAPPGDLRGRSLVGVARDYDLVSALRAALREGAPQRRLIELGHPARQVQLTCTPLTRSSSEGQALLVLQDVTELQRADAVRREFVANVSHELRTPVASLKAMAETLASGALDDPPAARSFVDRIELEADRLAQLVEELLELARLEGGRAFVEGERVDVAAVVTRAAERVRPLADRRAVALEAAPGASGA